MRFHISKLFLFQTHVHVGTGWTEKKCLDLVFAVTVEAYECNVIHLNGEVAMAKLTACHANSCIYMLTQEKEFGVLCTNFTVHNSISNYDCFIILEVWVPHPHDGNNSHKNLPQLRNCCYCSVSVNLQLYLCSHLDFILLVSNGEELRDYIEVSLPVILIFLHLFYMCRYGGISSGRKELSWNDSVPSAW